MIKDAQSIVRKLYVPVQPAAGMAGAATTYIEFLPDDRLKGFIYYYWELKTRKALTQPLEYKVVADGCIDVFFEMDYPQNNFVMGFSDTYTHFQLKDSFRYVGIRFLPAMFTKIFNIKASELSNRIEDLQNVLPVTSRFIAENFEYPISGSELKKMLDFYFLRLTSDVDAMYDDRIREAVHVILKNSGSLQVEKELKTGVSPRQLRRLFDFYIGCPPKTFSKVVRFQNLLQAKPSAQSLAKNKTFFDAGYYDQAHFIKEFKTLYGDTPAHALRK